MQSLQSSDWLLLVGGLLVLAGIASSMIARRFGAPLLLVFLVLGMLLGEDGPGGVQFQNYGLTYLLGLLALSVILFDGGMRTRVASFHGALGPAAMLASVGVLVTAALTGVAAWWLLDVGPAQAFLIGAIVGSTDAAAVFFLLRANGLHLQKRVGATLEIESGSNDPMAMFLTIAVVGFIASAGAGGPGELALSLALQIVLGVVAGGAGGWLITVALNRLSLPPGLHPLLAVASAVTLMAATNRAGGSGLLAVYLAGMVVGNRPVRAFAHVLSVQDAATWFAQLVMFLVLGLLVTPTRLLEVLLPALGISAFLMFVARPVAVWLCLAPFRFRASEINYISWVGLRGAVGIFLSSIPWLAGLPYAETYFNVAFVVVLASLLVQGWTLAPVAYWLKVALPRRDPPSSRVELDLPGQLEYEMVGYRVEPESAVLGGTTVPGWARAALVVRNEKVLMPDEAGALQSGDYAYYLAPPQRVMRLDWLFAEPSEAREAERQVFGEFSLPGDVPLGALAEFYDLQVPERHATRTAAELFARRYEGEPQIGDRVQLGRAVLVARELRDERVSKVGLKFDTMRARLFGSPGRPRAGGRLRRLATRLRLRARS